ncbi:Hypothetical protein, putative [Bodo saltans]|uniref:Protein kinase n=1 Tax=Bodo saltans TaxID=75058 RepID=A0A0S4JS63_BODSA|nr:Hypothetical protein, putative [Bodo saltans]|eukprot:CUG93190.1 Hypothetical protein, putative [Bodo saltans]
MSVTMDAACSVSQQYILSADRVVLGEETGSDGGLWEGVLKTAGQRNRAVAIKRVFGSDAASRIRHDIRQLLSRRRVVGLVDVTPTESYVVLES